MSDFFKQFRENWENRPEPDFKEQDWKALENRLDQGPSRRSSGLLFWWLLLPFLGLLLSTNIWSLVELRKANRKITSLEIQKDTLFQSHVTIQRDTIYQTRIIRETVQTFAYAPAVNFSYNLGGLSQPFSLLKEEHLPTTTYKRWETAPLSNPLIALRTINKAALIAPDSTENTIKNKIFFDSELAYLDQNPLGFLARTAPPFPYEANPIIQRKKTIRQHLHSMRPKAFQLGAGGGWVNPLGKMDDINQLSGFSLGLQGTIEFSDNLRLWLDASFSESKYEAHRMDETLGVLQIAPPSDEFTFFKAEVPLPSLNYSMGMDYQLGLKGNFKPFLGAGFGTAIILSDETTYEFRNDPLDIVVTVDHTNLGRMVFSDLYLMRTGFDYQLSNHWDWRLWGTYRAKWGRTSVFVPRTINVQTSLMYRF